MQRSKANKLQLIGYVKITARELENCWAIVLIHLIEKM